MEQAEILQGNIMIAKFMGFINLQSPNWFSFVLDDGTLKEFHIGSPIEYHLSWDLLMPACKKFISLQDNFKDIIPYELHCDTINSAVTSYDVLPAWVQLIGGIEWYNKQELPND